MQINKNIMKLINKILSKIQFNLCNLIGCSYPIPIKYGKALRQNNSFSRHYHISDFSNLDFPQKQIYKFFVLKRNLTTNR